MNKLEYMLLEERVRQLEFELKGLRGISLADECEEWKTSLQQAQEPWRELIRDFGQACGAEPLKDELFDVDTAREYLEQIRKEN